MEDKVLELYRKIALIEHTDKNSYRVGVEAIESYTKKQAVEFAEWFATVSHLDLRTSSTWENVYDEFINQQG